MALFWFQQTSWGARFSSTTSWPRCTINVRELRQFLLVGLLRFRGLQKNPQPGQPNALRWWHQWRAGRSYGCVCFLCSACHDWHNKRLVPLLPRATLPSRLWSPLGSDRARFAKALIQVCTWFAKDLLVSKPGRLCWYNRLAACHRKKAACSCNSGGPDARAFFTDKGVSFWDVLLKIH